MKEALIRGWFWLAIILGVAGYVVSILLGIGLVTSILFMVIVLGSLFFGILVTLYIPLPMPLKFLAGMVAAIVAIWYGAKMLGVIQ